MIKNYSAFLESLQTNDLIDKGEIEKSDEQIPPRRKYKYRYKYEEPYDYGYGKTPFTRWLKSSAENFSQSGDFSNYSGFDSETTDSNRAKSFLNKGVSWILGLSASLFDYLTPDGTGKSKEKIESDLDDWEDKYLNKKTLDKKDVDSFYKSGVLEGKKKFGRDYNYFNPRNEREKQYGIYLTGATKRLYDRAYQYD